MKKINSDDQLVITECKEVLKKLLIKFLNYSIPPSSIVALAKALYAISNYPKKVISGFVDITAYTRGDGGLTYYSIYISSSEIQLYNGGSIYDEGVGSDSFSDLFYSTSESTEHDILVELDSWLDTFNSFLNFDVNNLSIEDEADLFDGEEIEEEDDE